MSAPSTNGFRIRRYAPDNGEGWKLDLRLTYHPDRLDTARPPVVLIPGYAMNTHVLGFHPEGLSLVEYLALEGFEVWACNLRGQGGSIRHGGSGRVGFRELALTDLPRVFDHIDRHTRTTPGTVHAIGCSLGATLLYAWLAHQNGDHGLASLVSVGGPLRWDETHPLLAVAFRNPDLAGALRVKNVRRLARTVLPVVKRFPALLSLYMNASIIDLDSADELVKTVDDPHPHLNRQMSHWLRHRDLHVAGVNVTEALDGLELPVLCVLANADGIVPPAAALSIQRVLGEDWVDVLEVGDDETWFAHADLFVSRHAQERVFAPLTAWLTAAGRPD